MLMNNQPERGFKKLHFYIILACCIVATVFLSIGLDHELKYKERGRKELINFWIGTTSAQEKASNEFNQVYAQFKKII